MLSFGLEDRCSESKSSAQKPGFRSHKTPIPIIYVQRWHRDLLIQLTLDAAVLCITSGPGTMSTEIFDVLVETDAGVAHLLAFRDETDASVVPMHHVCVSLRRSSVLREPQASNARSIWSMRKKIVPLPDRLRILTHLQAAPAGMPISELISCVAASSIEPVEAVMSLACEGLLAINLDAPLVPETIVRLNPQPGRVPRSAVFRPGIEPCSTPDRV